MKRLLIVAAIAVIVAPAFAGGEVQPIGTLGYLNYNAATGEITKVAAETRRVGSTIWEAPYECVGWVFGQDLDGLGEFTGDWGDVAIGSVVGGFEFSQFTNSRLGDGDCYSMILFYKDDGGFGDTGKEFVAGIILENIPGNEHAPNMYWGYVWRVELDTAFVLDGADLDADGLGDFGYIFVNSVTTPGSLHGPGLFGSEALMISLGYDPNDLPPQISGADQYLDSYLDVTLTWNDDWTLVDPNAAADPNYHEGTYYWWPNTLDAYGQLHMVLFSPACPNRGDAGRYCQADIAVPPDCLVGLPDLAALLSNYGCVSPDPNGPDLCTLGMGDVDPYDEWFPGDGDVDLADLAEMLGQYGDNCNWPQ